MYKIVRTQIFASFISIFMLLSPSFASAASFTLNNLTAKSQFLATTTGTSSIHMIIDSVTDTHTFHWDGTPWAVAQGGTGATGFTAGSLPFIFGGVFAQDNANLYWDGTDSILGIGTNALSASSARLTVKGIVGKPLLNLVSSLGTSQLFVDQNGNVGFGNSTPQHKIDVSGAIYSRLVTLTDAPTVTVDWNAGNVQTLALSTNNTALTFANGQPGGEYKLFLNQDATGGRTVTWPANVQWPGGASPTLTSSQNGKDLLSFVYDGSIYAGTSALHYTPSGSSGGGGGGSQQIAFDYTSETQDTSGSDIILPFSVGSGNNRMLIVGVATEASPSPDIISGATFNGVPSTLLTKIQYTSAEGPDEVYLFALPAPTSGQHDIVVARSGSGYAAVYAVSYTGVDQSIPANLSTSTGTGITASLPITVQNSGAWVAGIMANNSACMTFASTGTVRQQPNCGRLQFDALGTTAQTQTFIANLNPAAVAPAWGGVAAELKPAQ